MRSLVFLYFLFNIPFSLGQDKIVIDVEKKYGGITFKSITSAIDEAKSIFEDKTNIIVVIQLSSGVHKISFPKNDSRLDFSKVKPRNHQDRLIFQGTGPTTTILESDFYHVFFGGNNVYRLTIQDLQFRRNHAGVSEGTITNIKSGQIEIEIVPPHPGLDVIYDPSWNQGRFLRKYIDEDTDCKIVTDNNHQISWSNYSHIHNLTWHIYLSNKHETTNYKIGDVIGIKSKCCKEGRNAYYFCGGDDITFQRIIWRRHSRGVLKCGISNILFKNITIKRDEGHWCMSTSGGGPQLGQPNELEIYNITVDNLHATGTGDDSVAFFNVKTGIIKNCHIRDSFARGILLHHSPHIVLTNNKVERCPIENKSITNK